MEKKWIFIGVILIILGAVVMFSSSKMTGYSVSEETGQGNSLFLYVIGFVILVVGILFEVQAKKKHFSTNSR